METRVAVIAVIVRQGGSVTELNGLLHQYAEHIIGRMGVPYPARGVSVISVAMDAPGDVISALSGKLGRAPRRHRQDGVRAGGGAAIVNAQGRPFQRAAGGAGAKSPVDAGAIPRQE